MRPHPGSSGNGGADMSDITLKHGLWVVVADGEKALFLSNRGRHAISRTCRWCRKWSRKIPPTREQGSDRPGRYNDGPSVHRSAVAGHRLAPDRQGALRRRYRRAALQAGASWRLQGDRADRAAAGAGRNAQEAAQGSGGQGVGRNSEDADQPRRLRYREACCRPPEGAARTFGLYSLVVRTAGQFRGNTGCLGPATGAPILRRARRPSGGASPDDA